MNDFISIAKISNFHGINGEVKLGFSKGKEDLIKSLKKIFINLNNEYTELKIKTIRFSKNFAIAKFEGLNSINDVLQYKGLNVYIKKEELKAELNEDEFLIDDLVGLFVYDNSDEFLGVVEGVGSNGGEDILCIRAENSEFEHYLVPFVTELVPIVDIKQKKIIIKPIEGLLE